MAEQAKGSGPEWNGLGTGPVTSFSDTSRPTPGDQFHLLSQPNSDQPSDLISSRAFGEPETLMALFGESDGFENAGERWESDRDLPKKWSIATKTTMIASVVIAVAIAIAIPLVFFENNRPLADATTQKIVVPKQTATTAPSIARQSGENLLATAEQNRPRDPTNALNSGLTPDDTAADTKSVGRGQNAPPQGLAATQSATTSIDKEELAIGVTPDDTAANTKSMGQGQNAPPQALAATQSAARSIDKEELANGLTPGDTAADSKAVGQGQNAPPQALAAPQSPARTIDKEGLASLAPSDTAADTKSVGQDQDAPPQALAAPQGPARTIDKGGLASLAPSDTAADTKSVGQGQNAPPQAPAATPSPAGRIGLTPSDTATDTKSVRQVQNASPQALATTQSPVRTIDKEELASLLKRARYLLSVGDIASARLLLERAADAHEASAAFDLAGTYDPAVLNLAHVLGIAPDLAMARMWYEKALSLGHLEAQQRLSQLQK